LRMCQRADKARQAKRHALIRHTKTLAKAQPNRLLQIYEFPTSYES
jgi:hypothetical protein